MPTTATEHSRPTSRWLRRIASTASALLLAVAGPAGAAVAAETAPAPQSVVDFFRHPSVASMVMSPSGRYLAATRASGPQSRQALIVLDLRDLSKSRLVAGFDDADITAVHWVNDDRLVFGATDNQAAGGSRWGNGLYAVDRAGDEPVRRLIKRREFFVTDASSIRARELSAYHRLHSVLRDGSSDVVVEQYQFDGAGEPSSVALWRLDTLTGATRALMAGAPAHVREWALDAQGAPRVAVSSEAGVSRLYWKPAAGTAWVLAREARTFGDGSGLIDPIFVDADDRLYLKARLAEEAGGTADTTSLARLSLKDAAAKPEPLVSLKGYDFAGTLVRGAGGRLLGVQYLTDARGSVWFDPALAKVQAAVDAALPGTGNLLDCGECADPQDVLVTSASDRQPTTYSLFNIKTGTLQPLLASRPWIAAKGMGTRDMVRIAARDGLALPTYVTRPPGVRGPAPMVVLVHGGPWVRGGEWAWSNDAQFLASRGYLVLEPEFRGSTGFGHTLFRAGWKQWGLKMQDDVADAARWAIAQGLADADRVCIAGASYGGYAVLMGLIRDPGLFRCGFEWVGVTDIDLMYSIAWSDSSEMWRTHGMPVLVGDRKKDAEQLAATSPLKLANRLRQPLLMAYGGADQRVPIEHGQQLRDALRAHNPDVEWIVYPDEGHGWALQANDVDFWTRVERFLERNLKNPSKVGVNPATAAATAATAADKGSFTPANPP